MPWIKRMLRGKPVYARVEDSGELAKGERGLVEVVYKLSPNAKIYNASPRNLLRTGVPEDDTPFDSDEAPPRGGAPKPPTVKAPVTADADAITIYTDGACSGNPGPMGIGAVIMREGEREEISEFLGVGTNNIAELTAIERALQTIPADERGRTVLLHTDSTYSIGVLHKGWKAKANTELVARIRSLVKEFSRLHFIKVKGHAGIPENERCDALATGAITDR